MKKGFTLIEIIVGIALITLIGVGSFIGIRLVDRKLELDKLNKITDKVLNAASVYFETNKVAYNELYNNKSAAIIPLKTLVNEGLLNLDNTKLDDQTIEKNYVVQYLGKGTGGGESNCTDLSTIITSWNSTTPIYICADSSGGINLKTINKDEYTNRMYGSNEPYYFRGSLVRNYAKIDGISGTVYRIILIDTDDSIKLYHSLFNHDFAGILAEQYYSGSLKHYNYNSEKYSNIYGCTNSILDTNVILYKETSVCEVEEVALDKLTNVYNIDSWVTRSVKASEFTTYQCSWCYPEYSTITLKPCMQISKGSGTEYDPYIIKPNNCK